MRKRAVFVVALVAVLLTAVGVGPAGAAPADPVGLPISGFSRIITDPRTGNLYLSSYADNLVLVLSPTGRLLRTLSDLDGAGSMAVVGDTLYVSLWKDQSIVALDTTTFSERIRYSTGAGTCPGSISPSGSVIWFGYGCNSAWGRGLGRLRLDVDPPLVELNQQDGLENLESVAVVSGRQSGAPVVMAQLGLSPATGYLFHIVDGAAKLRATSRGEEGMGYNLLQLVMMPDSTQVLVVSGAPYYINVLSTTTFEKVGRYDVNNVYPSAAAVSADGRYVAAGNAAGTHFGYDVFVYQAGRNVPLTRIEFGTNGGDYESNIMAEGGLAWSADGSRLYAITENQYGEKLALRVYTPLAGARN